MRAFYPRYGINIMLEYHQLPPKLEEIDRNLVFRHGVGLEAKNYLFDQVVRDPILHEIQDPEVRDRPIATLIEKARSAELGSFAQVLAQTQAWQHLIDQARRNDEVDKSHLAKLEEAVHEELNRPLEEVDAAEIREGVFDLAEDVFTQRVTSDQLSSCSRSNLNYFWEGSVAEVAKKVLGIRDIKYYHTPIFEKFAYDFHTSPPTQEKYWYQRLHNALTYAQIARFFQGKNIDVSRYLYERGAGSGIEIKSNKKYSEAERFLNTAVLGKALEAMDESLVGRVSKMKWDETYHAISQAHDSFTCRVFEGFEKQNEADSAQALTYSLDTQYEYDDHSYMLGMALNSLVSDQNIAHYLVLADQIPEYANCLAEAAIASYQLLAENKDPRGEGVAKLILLRHRDYLQQNHPKLYEQAFKDQDQPENFATLRQEAAKALVSHTKHNLRRKVAEASISDFNSENAILALDNADNIDQFSAEAKHLGLKTLYSFALERILDSEVATLMEDVARSGRATHALTRLQRKLTESYKGLSSPDALYMSFRGYTPLPRGKKTVGVGAKLEFLGQYAKALCSPQINLDLTRVEMMGEFFKNAKAYGVTKEQLVDIYNFTAGCFAACAEVYGKSALGYGLIFYDPLNALPSDLIGAKPIEGRAIRDDNFILLGLDRNDGDRLKQTRGSVNLYRPNSVTEDVGNRYIGETLESSHAKVEGMIKPLISATEDLAWIERTITRGDIAANSDLKARLEEARNYDELGEIAGGNLIPVFSRYRARLKQQAKRILERG